MVALPSYGQSDSCRFVAPALPVNRHPPKAKPAAAPISGLVAPTNLVPLNGVAWGAAVVAEGAFHPPGSLTPINAHRSPATAAPASMASGIDPFFSVLSGEKPGAGISPRRSSLDSVLVDALAWEAGSDHWLAPENLLDGLEGEAVQLRWVSIP